MISVSTSELGAETGLAGRKFKISGRGIDFEIFFGIPLNFRDFLNWREDVILPYLGILALLHRQDIDLNGFKVDPEFIRNVRCALNEVARLNRNLRAPEISGAILDTGVLEKADAAGVFFSGGIDSFFSVLRHCGQTTEASRNLGPAHYAIHIYHTDELVDPDEFNTLRSLSDTAQTYGMKLIPIQSNFMTVDRQLHDHWADLGHGAALATVLHLLSAGMNVGIIGSTHTWGQLVPWGSSPVTDPLWSSQRMEVIHDDARFSRVEKTALVAQSADALSGLNVCDTRIDGQGYVNCSHCPKCLRTMVTLDLFGVGNNEEAPCFDWSDYSPSSFSKVFLRTDNDAAFATEIRDAAAERGRQDIVDACNIAVNRGKIFRLVSRTEDLVKNSRVGRKYRSSLKLYRKRLYRSLGWATKSG